MNTQKLKIKVRQRPLSSICEKNLRYTIHNAIKKDYGNVSLNENIKAFEQDLCLSSGCLDNLSNSFTISMEDLEKICCYLNPPPFIIFYWIKHYGNTKTY